MKKLFNIKKEEKTKPKDVSLKDKVFAFKKKEGYPKEEVIEEARQKPAPEENTNTSTTASGTMVWITAKGKRYHRSSSCSNMKNPYTVTLEQAQASGRTPCRKCW